MRRVRVPTLLVLLARPTAPLGESACPEEAVAAVFEAVHEGVLGTANTCLGFQNDVYQRFSGYVAKHRLTELCETALAALEGLRLLAALACGELPAGSLDSGLLEFSAIGEGSAWVAGRLSDLERKLGDMLTDTNSQGDGQFHAAVGEHLASFAGHVLKAHEADRMTGGPDGSRWLNVVATLADHLSRLFRAAFETVQEGVTYNIGNLRISQLTRFLGLLDSFPATVSVDVRRGGRPSGDGGICRDLSSIYRSQHVFDPIADPKGWRTPDVSGLYSPRPPVQKLLFTISRSVPLSYNVLAVMPRVQSGSQELTSEYQNMFSDTGGRSSQASYTLREPACDGVGIAYSPPQCLFDAGWGSMTFSLSTEPPYDGVLAVAEMSLKSLESRPKPFVQPVANSAESMEKLIDFVDSVYKSLNTPSPDVLFLSPIVGNCVTLRKLGPSRRQEGGGTPQLTPKLVWVPINPLVAPPWRLAPNFTEWHSYWLSNRGRSAAGHGGEAVWWLAQCSLASAVDVLQDQGYALLHVEHGYAVFLLRVLWSAVAPMMQASAGDYRTRKGQESSPESASLFDHWLRGWACSPVASTLFGLEWKSGVDLSALHSRHASESEKLQRLCDFVRIHQLPLSPGEKNPSCQDRSLSGEDAHHGALDGIHSWKMWELEDTPEERGKAYVLESTGRGRCLQDLGFCECFPPFRGRFCEDSEPGRHDETRPFRAVLHYLVGDKDRLLRDLSRTLLILWETFNEQFDYPVVVFHDGLAPASRQRIMEASRNRIWFAFVDDYTAVPAYLKGRMEQELGGYSIGYRGMCRFRSGRMFMQPVLSGFDYAWTLDTDGYFPAKIHTDPFERMWRGGHVYGYSHVSRDQASSVQHFWEFCRVFIETKGLDPKGTKMMRRLTDALLLRDTFWHEWNRVLFMNDIEITKLDWFRGKQYQDFFQFLDSVGGFWLYRWGDHAVRTIAIALFLDAKFLMKMEVPYGHQNSCLCGAEHPEEVCVRSSPLSWWQCVLRSEAPPSLAGSGADAASGDVGTVHDELLFGGE